jgi:hypothetical protein
MNRTVRAIAGTAVALAASAGYALAGSIPAHASPSPGHDLAAAIVSGQTVGIDGHTYAGVIVQRWSRAECSHLLAAYRKVSRQAGLRIGSRQTQAISNTGPATWAYELRRGGDYPLARLALAIHSRPSDERFVLALTDSAAAALQGSGCRACPVGSDPAHRGCMAS